MQAVLCLVLFCLCIKVLSRDAAAYADHDQVELDSCKLDTLPEHML